MKTFLRSAAFSVLTLILGASCLHAQGQPEAQAKSAGTCPELPELMARMAEQSRRLKDWPDLAHYREANAKLPAPAKDEQRRFHGRLHHGHVGAAAIWRIFPRQAVHRAGNWRADDAADGGAFSSGRDRSASQRGGDSGGNERPRGEHRSHHAGGNRRKSFVDGGARARQWNSRGAVFRDAGQQLWARWRRQAD